VSFIVAVMLNACCGFAGVSFFQKVSFGATESQLMILIIYDTIVTGMSQ